jgi:hypothetical protein
MREKRQGLKSLRRKGNIEVVVYKKDWWSEGNGKGRRERRGLSETGKRMEENGERDDEGIKRKI